MEHDDILERKIISITHIQHHGRLAIKPGCISVPIISSKLLQPANRLLAVPSSIEGIIGAETHRGEPEWLADKYWDDNTGEELEREGC